MTDKLQELKAALKEANHRIGEIAFARKNPNWFTGGAEKARKHIYFCEGVRDEKIAKALVLVGEIEMKMLESGITDIYKSNRACSLKEIHHIEKLMHRKWGKLKWFWRLFKNYGLRPLPSHIKGRE